MLAGLRVKERSIFRCGCNTNTHTHARTQTHIAAEKKNCSAGSFEETPCPGLSFRNQIRSEMFHNVYLDTLEPKLHLAAQHA